MHINTFIQHKMIRSFIFDHKLQKLPAIEIQNMNQDKLQHFSFAIGALSLYNRTNDMHFCDSM